MAKFIPVDPFDIVIFGATGDLTKRKLLPALFHRFLDGQIDESSRIIGVARTQMNLLEFKEVAKDGMKHPSRMMTKSQLIMSASSLMAQKWINRLTQRFLTVKMGLTSFGHGLRRNSK